MSNAKSSGKLTKRQIKERCAEIGRAFLKEWLLAAHVHGTIYYNIISVSRSGMRRQIRLYTVMTDGSKTWLEQLRPNVPMKPNDAWEVSGLEDHGVKYSEALDIIAKDWGFGYDKQAFIANGCGMDMVYDTIDYLVKISGIEKPGAFMDNIQRSSL